MLRALQTAATGMEAMQANVNTVANNLANVNTTGFKKDVSEFQDLFYQTVREPGAVVSDNTASPTGVQVGSGVKTSSIHKIYEQGSAKVTNNPLDLMINGDGFFGVQKDDGQIAYTRDGSFKVDAQGRVMSSHGYLLTPPITIPPNAIGVSVAANGAVSIRDAEGKTNQIGQIQVVNFVNPSGLLASGGNLLQVSEASGAPIQGNPGSNGIGNLEQGHLEASNVNVVNEMVNMIQAQRAYEMNSKVIQAADQMLQVSSNVLK
jgi:flagellar basal-body rod protein FlgG